MKNEYGILSLIFSLIGVVLFICVLTIAENLMLIVVSFITIIFSLLGLIFGVIQKKHTQTIFGKTGFIMGLVILILSVIVIIWFFISSYILLPNQLRDSLTWKPMSQ